MTQNIIEIGDEENTQNENSSKLTNETFPSFGRNLWEYFSEYSRNTSLHGVKYMGAKKRSIVERLTWLFIISVSLLLCILSIEEIYTKWKSSPVIVNFANAPTPISQVPFPAITICPETKIRRSEFNYTKAFLKYREERSNMTEEELKRFEQTSLVCNGHPHTSGNKTTGYDTIEYLASVAPQFLWMCKWINDNHTCYELFTPTLTEEGVCYTFNMLNRKELFTNLVFHKANFSEHEFTSTKWSLEDGYKGNTEMHTFPRRAIAAGHKACLGLVMTLYNPDLDYVCKGPLQGFKLIIHNPAETPRVSQNYLRAPLNQEVILSIIPEVMTTSKNLRKYPSNVRKCYFAKERQLKYFQIYTQRNCEVECLTNYTLKMCGCVSYHMPHNEATDICGTGSTECVQKAEAAIIENEMETGRFTDQRRCKCLPSCTSINYQAEISQAEFDWLNVFLAYMHDPKVEMPGVQFTRLTIFFKQQQFTKFERNELYGTEKLFAKYGGLLGLFIGYSMLSLAEILYFLTLRLICNIRMYGRHFWSGSAELLENKD